MQTVTHSSRRFGAFAIFMLTLPVLALPTAARSEETRAGVVTKLVGTATVARATLAQPAALQFKDDVLLKDRITTGESSAVRVLLGGKATITARERSVITITEIPGVATVGLASGRAAIAVAKEKMKAGEIVEIRTPNAVVAVRGTVVIAEVEPVVGGHRSTITILKGLVDVTKLDSAGRLTGAAVDVRMLERVVVTTAKPLAAAEKISRQTADGLAAEFSFVPKTGPTASTEALTEKAKEAAIDDAMRAVGMAPDPRTMSASNSGVTSDAPGAVPPAGSGPEVMGNSTTNPTSNPGSTPGNVATGATTTVGNTVNTTTNTVGTTVNGVTTTVGNAVTGVTTGVGNTVTGATTAVGNTVTGVTTAVGNTVTAVTSSVPVVGNTVSTVVPVVTTTVNTVVPVVTNTVNTVVPVVTNTVNTVVPTVTSVVPAVVTPTVTTVVPVVTAPVVNIVAPVVNTVTTTLTNVVNPAAPTVPNTGGLLSGLGLLGKK